jgi:hypothetical protein
MFDAKSMPSFDLDELRIRDDGHWSQSDLAFVAEKIKALIETH